MAVQSDQSLDPRAPVMKLLERFGPGSDAGAAIDAGEAIAYCHALARSHYENFSVLTALVPPRMRDGFAAVYAYCRWADDLADETGSGDEARRRSTELLAWWRDELRLCFGGGSTHPVFVALSSVRERHGLAMKPFEDLITAFEQDQTKTRYENWDQLTGYCAGSANPAGRLVLALAGLGDGKSCDEPGLYEMSDATCTALQLVNFWQDVRRDLLDRDRVYLPKWETGVDDAMLRSWIGDPSEVSRAKFAAALKPLMARTDELFQAGAALPKRLNQIGAEPVAPVVGMFGAGGRSLHRAIERGGCQTLWARPTVSRRAKAAIFFRAWLGAFAVRHTRSGAWR